MRLISWNRLLRKNCRVEHATKFAFLFRRIQVFLLIDTSAFLGKKPVSQEVELGENPTTFSATPIKKRCRLSCPTLWRFHAEYSAFYSLAFLTFPQKPKKIIHSGLRSAAIHPVYSQQNQRCFVIWNPLPVVHPDRFWLECSFVLSSKSSESSFSHKPEKGFHPNQSLPFPICVFGLSMLPTSENYLIVYSQEICLFVGLSLCDYKIS